MIFLHHESTHNGHKVLLSLLCIIQIFYVVKPECNEVTISGLFNSTLTGSYGFIYTCHHNHQYKSQSHSSLYFYQDEAGYWVISERDCDIDANKDAYARISASVDDAECITGDWEELDTESGDWNININVKVDCLGECETIHVGGLSGDIWGGYEEDDKCNSRPLYKHADNPFYLYYDPNNTGYWVASDRKCMNNAHQNALARVHDDARYPHCMDTDWFEYDRETDTWDRNTYVPIYCEGEKEDTGSSSGLSPMAIGLICSGCGVFVFILIFYFGKRWAMKTAKRTARSRTAPAHYASATVAATSPARGPISDGQDSENLNLPPAYINYATQISDESPGTRSEYSTFPESSDSMPKPPSYDEAVAGQYPLPSFGEAVKLPQPDQVPGAQMAQIIEPSAPLEIHL